LLRLLTRLVWQLDPNLWTVRCRIGTSVDRASVVVPLQTRRSHQHVPPYLSPSLLVATCATRDHRDCQVARSLYPRHLIRRTVMNTPPLCGGAPEWLRELAAARTHYEEMFGWPVTIKVEQQVVAAPVGRVLDVVTMPAPLGGRVLAELQLMMLVGPVIAAPDDSSWMFFTEPVIGAARDVPAELRHLQVHLMPEGAHVVIPTRIDSHSGLRWIKQPQPHRPSPPWSVISGIARRVAAKSINDESAVSPTSDSTEEREVLIAS
jgi:hypothetical protein